jgi:flotillin
MDVIFELGIPAALILVAIFVIGMIIGRLYHRAEKDRAYVRTGFGGQKVVVDGGSVVLPIFQSIAWVNLQTLRLDVHRDSQDAMITKDRMRVDIGVEFYVRVKPDGSSIALAAQTLGERTNDVAQLRELVEAKFVDALRSVAATMSLADLQEKRSDFVKAVQSTVANDLELNGLELESASLTKLDQTDTKFFNPNNAFDAEGLAALTKIVEAKRQERNQTVRNAEVAIAQQDLDATQKTLEIMRLKKDAELSQQRDIANKTAETRAAAALKEAEPAGPRPRRRFRPSSPSPSGRRPPSRCRNPPPSTPISPSSRSRSRPSGPPRRCASASSATSSSQTRRAPLRWRTRAAPNPRRAPRPSRRVPWRPRRPSPCRPPATSPSPNATSRPR